MRELLVAHFTTAEENGGFHFVSLFKKFACMTNLEIHIDVPTQSLKVLDKTNDKIVFEAAISTATNGVGEQLGSECTPRGRHIRTGEDRSYSWGSGP